jgi:hypothetical protein
MGGQSPVAHDFIRRRPPGRHSLLTAIFAPQSVAHYDLQATICSLVRHGLPNRALLAAILSPRSSRLSRYSLRTTLMLSTLCSPHSARHTLFAKLCSPSSACPSYARHSSACHSPENGAEERVSTWATAMRIMRESGKSAHTSACQGWSMIVQSLALSPRSVLAQSSLVALFRLLLALPDRLAWLSPAGSTCWLACRLTYSPSHSALTLSTRSRPSLSALALSPLSEHSLSALAPWAIRRRHASLTCRRESVRSPADLCESLPLWGQNGTIISCISTRLLTNLDRCVFVAI